MGNQVEERVEDNLAHRLRGQEEVDITEGNWKIKFECCEEYNSGPGSFRDRGKYELLILKSITFSQTKSITKTHKQQ